MPDELLNTIEVKAFDRSEAGRKMRDLVDQFSRLQDQFATLGGQARALKLTLDPATQADQITKLETFAVRCDRKAGV